MPAFASAEPASVPTELVPPEPEAQRAHRARLDSILRAAGMIGWEWDVERNRVHHLGDVEALTGSAWRPGWRFTHFVHPDDRLRFAETLRDCWLNDTEYAQEFRVVRTDGGVRWVSDVGRPAIFPDGRRWMSGVLTDITARKQAEAAAQASRARLDYALQAARMTAWDWDPQTGMVIHTADLNHNLDTDEVIKRREQLAELMHPEDRARVLSIFETAFVNGTDYHAEYRLRRPDGGYGWVASSGRALDGPDGRRRMSGVMTDITDRKTAELHRDLLINELNHRVKNTLAVIQGVAAQTFRGREDEPARVFQGRLMALSTAHNVLTGQGWESASLARIVEDAVRPFTPKGDEARIVARGPDLPVAPKSAVAIAMAIHELASNAVKYGALSVPDGRVTLDWTQSRDERFQLTWREAAGPTVRPPARRGFGLRMIERGLATELGGSVHIDFRPEGLLCTIDAPLPRPTPEETLHA